MNDFFVNLELANFYEDLETSSSATSIVKKQEGNYFENLLTYSFINSSNIFVIYGTKLLSLYSDLT